MTQEDVVHSALPHYIKYWLVRNIANQNMKCYHHMRFVDFVDGVVQVIIGREVQQTNSLISCNVFINGFVQVYVRPLILEKFLIVDRLEYVKITDKGFDGIVRSLDRTVKYANYWETFHIFHQCMRLFGDNLPLV